jgi:hypothetical protein
MQDHLLFPKQAIQEDKPKFTWPGLIMFSWEFQFISLLWHAKKPKHSS